jgi:Amt family ammonium transporter
MINAGDTAWILTSSALVMLMTPALAFFYGGLVRKKNLLSTIMLSLVMLALISLQWVLYGYSLAFGPDKWNGLIGGLQWLGLNGVGQAPNPDYASTIPHLAFMIFQAMFAIITPALITGAFVERVNFSGFLVFALFWATLVYDPVAHWVWGKGGWLSKLGVLDFAGGLVVHLTAGMSALATALVIGRRRGFEESNFEPNNIPFTVLGGGILWFGWFGFNAGSALTSGGLASNAFVATHISGASAAFTWMILSWMKGKPSLIGFVTGAIAGEVAITPASGFVPPIAAIPIGVISAILVYFTMYYRLKFKIDDSLDVFACHGVAGIWGVLATGIFASQVINSAGSDGLVFGNFSQLATQLLGVVVVGVYAFVLTLVLAKVIDAMFGLRVRKIEEEIGLDISQHAENAYSLF